MDRNDQMSPVPNTYNPAMSGGMSGASQQLYTAEQVQKMMEPKKDTAGLIKTIVIVVVSLIATTFIGLFIWMMVEYNFARSDVDGQINKAVAEAKNEQAMQDVETCQKEKENPYTIFSGPVDYGELSFQFPKTWSVYIASSASNGGDYKAYLNPGQVDDVSDKSSLYALRVTIQNKAFDDVVANYQKSMERKDSNLSIETITVNGASANRYTGTIPGTEFNGIVVIFKIRDKTAILQTDSMLFEQYFNDLINTITFNA